MVSTFATFLGIDANLIMLATVLLAAVVTTLAVILITFFALAPHLSSTWASQFGTTEDEPQSG